MSNKQTDILRAIKALRRSIKGEEKAKAHVSIGPKSAVAIVPPKKVRSLQPSQKPLYGLRGLSATCFPVHFTCTFWILGTMTESGPCGWVKGGRVSSPTKPPL